MSDTEYNNGSGGSVAEAIPSMSSGVEQGEQSPEFDLATENSQIETRIDIRAGYLDNLEKTYTGTNEYGERSNGETFTATNQSFEKGFDANVADFLAEQDPEKMLGNLRGMSDAELDRVIAEIEKGDLDTVKTFFGEENKTQEPEKNETQVEEMSETEDLKKELSIAIDEYRYADLKKILEVAPEEVIAGETMDAEVSVYDQLEGVIDSIADDSSSESTAEHALAETSAVKEEISPVVATKIVEKKSMQEKAVQAKTSIKAEENQTNQKNKAEKYTTKEEVKAGQGQKTKEKIIPDVEAFTEEKFGGAVIYDLRKEMLSLADVPVLLVEDKKTGVWSLPETMIPDGKKEKDQISKDVEGRSGVESEMEDEIERKKYSFKSDSGDGHEEETVYFTGSADHEKPIKQKSNFHWVTFGDILKKGLKIDKHSERLLKKVSADIEKEIQRNKKG